MTGYTPADAPQNIFTVQYVEQSNVTAKITPSEARDIFGLGGTPDEEVGRRIQSLAEREPRLLSRLGAAAVQVIPYSWTLQKIDDPWGDF